MDGTVSSARWPTITVSVFDKEGLERTVQARLDTGFSDDLTLPIAAINRLGLKSVDRSNFRIGDNTTVTFNTYAATIRWHGVRRQIIVLESEVAPVLGVGLMWESNLSIDFRHGGDVIITKLPEPGL